MPAAAGAPSAVGSERRASAREGRGVGATLPEIVRGESAEFTHNARFVVYRLKPTKSVVDSLEKAKTQADRMPRDSVAILDLTRGATFKAPNRDGRGWPAALDDRILRIRP